MCYKENYTLHNQIEVRFCNHMYYSVKHIFEHNLTSISLIILGLWNIDNNLNCILPPTSLIQTLFCINIEWSTNTYVLEVASQ